MIYAIAFVGLLQLMTMGMLTSIMNENGRVMAEQRSDIRKLSAALMEMAGEPRAARIVERQTVHPGLDSPIAPIYEEMAEKQRAARRASVPYGLRAR